MDSYRPQSLMEKMTDSCFFNQSENALQHSETAVYVLGRKFKINRDNVESEIESIKLLIRMTIWLTYRNNFPPLLDSNYVSDTGWGCMIRAGQMVLAQVIKRHLKNQGDLRDDDLTNIAMAFADDDGQEHKNLLKILNNKESRQRMESPFSIQSIAILANSEFKLKPGEWYKPNYILFILETLHNRFPIRGSDSLRMMVFNDSSIFLDKIVEKMFNFKNLRCEKHKNNHKSGKQAKLVCETCLNDRLKDQKANSIAIFILTRIGLEEPNPNYLNVLDDIMELPSFQGIVGGSPGRALYILGKVGQQYIYLDPHYVQLSTTRKSIILDKTTFQCPYLHLMQSKDVDTSMGLAFYLRDYQDLDLFWEQLQIIKTRHGDNFFIYKADTAPDFSDSLNNNIFPQDSEEVDDDIIFVE